MARSSLLLFSLCAASTLIAQYAANTEEVAMLKVSPCEPSARAGTAQERIGVLESQMKEVFTGTMLGDCGAKAASARPQIHSNRLFFKADALLWKAFFGGSDYAATDNSLEALMGEVKRADFRWRGGFRVEGGYHLPHDNWDFLVTYTWFHDKAVKSVDSSSGTIVPLIPPFASYSAGASASIRWPVRLQNLDIDLRRPYFLNRHFSVAPFIGLRNAWIDHGYYATYTDPDGDVVTTNVYAKQNFWGIGPVAGMGTEWHITSHWWIFSSFAGAVLASNYDVISRVYNDGVTVDDLSADTQRLSPTIQGALGFGWHMNMNRCRNHLALRFSYEGQYWWKQNLTIHYASTTYPIVRLGEDLGFHGFTFDMLFDF